MALFDQMKDIFSSVKEKSAEVAVSLKERGTEVAAIAADKTKDAARIAKLTVDLGAEKDNLKKAYLELGKACYEAHKDSAEGLFAQLCEEISVAAARVDAMQAELDGLKGGFRVPAQEPEPDFEAVVAGQEADITVEITQEPGCESCEAPTCDGCDAKADDASPADGE